MESEPAKVEIFAADYARQALTAQAVKHDSRVAFFKSNLEAIWNKMAADGYVLGRANDSAKARLDATGGKNVTVSFK